MNKRFSFMVLALVTVLSLLLASCGAPATPVATEPPAPTQAPPTPVPAPTEPPAPEIGTADNPIIMALAPSATSQELQTGGQAIADKLSEMTGYTIKISVPTNYAALVEAMGSGNAHIGWLPPLAYMLAKYKGYADVGLVVLRCRFRPLRLPVSLPMPTASTTMAPPCSPPTTIPPPARALPTPPPPWRSSMARKPCWTDPLSASGYVLPVGVLAKEAVKVKAGAWVQGHPTVIKSVYLSPKGEICDFGATYIDARTAVVKDFPDVNDKVQVIYVSDPIIPNDNVSFAANRPGGRAREDHDAAARAGRHRRRPRPAQERWLRYRRSEGRR